jgi:thiol-disulfide isomerase/thioredoxin
MPGIVEVVSNLVRPYYYYIIAIIIIVIFGYVARYAYNTYYTKTVENKFADVANANRRNKEADVMFFHVDWCPHCKKALPEWNNFKKQYDDKEINGYIIKCRDIDCTNESSDVTSLINTYNIESYPTVKLLKDTNTIDFETKITSHTLEQFVNTMLID